ncbi:hypothetical protein SAMN05443572_102495 [Myxococcus fulvus]|uniref:Leucine rich repeat variant n=1 Tax=Myxococcus fulvus TaxID=33 RepID=A0A511SY65_MYXFU|nr:hypothetical protein [Myxococcus fulvus]GEN06392.1 hypothetical protein MFU01_14290 [Myxococcus fulvus]SET49950.1 hypothetical protein SAMN05443572_102495 [Myxococcus fulvus]
MPSLEEARNVARFLHALGGGASVRRKAAARELSRGDPLDANELVGHLISLARQGWEPATCVLSDFMAALAQEAEHIPHVGALRRLAHVQSLDTVADLFAQGPAKREMHPDAAARADANAFSQSLGHLKQQARLTRDPDTLSRLATVSNPSVLRNVLINPRLTEELVVRVAARRPARPEPLVEIWRSPRWSVRHAVRRALVFNPYLPPEVGAKIVPLLNTGDLRELISDNSVHASLREQASRLLAETPESLRSTRPGGTEAPRARVGHHGPD